MKYLKQAFVLLLTVCFLAGCIIFPVSAAGADPGAQPRPNEITLLAAGYFGWTFDIGYSEDWSEIAADVNADNTDRGFMAGADNSVLFGVEGYGQFFITDKDGEIQYFGTPVSANTTYYLNQEVTFTIEEHDEFKPLGVSYTFTKTLNVFTLDQLAHKRIVFDHPDLGKCMFVEQADGILFQVGKQADGSFTNAYFLATQDFKLFSSGNDVLRSGNYYAVPICSTGVHLVDQWQTVQAASCTVNGTKSGFCKICGTLDPAVILSEGHSYDFWGNCTKCADKTGLAGVGESVGNFFGGLFDSSSGTDNVTPEDSEKEPVTFEDWWNNLWDKEDNAADEEPDTLDKLKDLGIIVLAILGGVFLIAVLPHVIKFFKWIRKVVKRTFKEIGELFKSARKAVRSGKGKRGRKK